MPSQSPLPMAQPSGLQRLEMLASDKQLAEDHRLHSVRAHPLEMSGETATACEAYRVAARRATNLPNSATDRPCGTPT